jgi:hypothetical protein
MKVATPAVGVEPGAGVSRSARSSRYFTSSDTGWLQSSAPVFVTAR